MLASNTANAGGAGRCAWPAAGPGRGRAGGTVLTAAPAKPETRRTVPDANLTMLKSLSGVYATDAGSLGLWDLRAFAQVADIESWEQALGRDEVLLDQVRRGRFVPVGVHQPADGCFAVELRAVGGDEPCTLDARESRYLLVRSQPFRLRCSGTLCLGGIEYIDADPAEAVGRMDLAPGDYAVEVCIIAWNDEPGMRQVDGQPAPEALPDFIVLVRPVRVGETFRVACHAFDPP